MSGRDGEGEGKQTRLRALSTHGAVKQLDYVVSLRIVAGISPLTVFQYGGRPPS